MKPSRDSKLLSIIIPVLNEEQYILPLLTYLRNYRTDLIHEIIVVDGGSRDKTVLLASQEQVRICTAPKGRASQMNYGASQAFGNILYFLHVDTFPPVGFDKAITEAVNKGFPSGCFRLKFDSRSRFLNFFAWFTRWNLSLCRGGDQSLFVTRELFERSGGFNEDFIIYEDTEFIGRLSKLGRFKVLSASVITSARKYRKIGNWKLQYHFGMIHLKRFFGAGPRQLHAYYRRHIAT